MRVIFLLYYSNFFGSSLFKYNKDYFVGSFFTIYAHHLYGKFGAKFTLIIM
jgi:hypothetical protein